MVEGELAAAAAALVATGRGIFAIDASGGTIKKRECAAQNATGPHVSGFLGASEKGVTVVRTLKAGAGIFANPDI